MTLPADHELVRRLANELQLGDAAREALRRPPFRLLHEIALQLSSRGCPFCGLFDDKERDISQFKLACDKEMSRKRKLLFISKMVAAVHFGGGIAQVDPADAVTGRKVPNTLELLLVCALHGTANAISFRTYTLVTGGRFIESQWRAGRLCETRT